VLVDDLGISWEGLYAARKALHTFIDRSLLPTDLVALTRKFYQTHADNFDQLVVWTDSAIVQDAFAYETTVANEIRGIGVDIYDASRDFGSGGRLRSLAIMDWLGKYPDDPTQQFLGEKLKQDYKIHGSDYMTSCYTCHR